MDIFLRVLSAAFSLIIAVITAGTFVDIHVLRMWSAGRFKVESVLNIFSTLLKFS